MPTFQTKLHDKGEPAAPTARQLTAEDRELMLKMGLPPEVADAYMAGGTFSCADEAVKHYRAQAEAAPKPYVSNWPELAAVPEKAHAYAVTYENGYAVQLHLKQPEVVAKLIHDGLMRGLAHVAVSGVHPLLFSLRGIRDFRAAAPGEFPANGPAQYAADMVVTGVIGGRAASVEIPVSMPDRKSETEVVRNPTTGEIERSVTIEKTVTNGGA